MTEIDICVINVRNTNRIQVKRQQNVQKKFLKGILLILIYNEKFVGDIAYIHIIKNAWCYLPSVLDLYSKNIISYAFSQRMINDLVTKVLKNVYYSQFSNKNKRLIFHNDLDSQYTSNELKELCS